MTFTESLFLFVAAFSFLAIVTFVFQLLGRKLSEKTEQESNDEKFVEEKQVMSEENAERLVPANVKFVSVKSEQKRVKSLISPIFVLALIAIFLCFVLLSAVMTWIGRADLSAEIAKIDSEIEKIIDVCQEKQIYGIAHIIDVFGQEVLPMLIKGPGPIEIENNYSLESMTEKVIISSSSATIETHYALKPALKQISNEITFTYGQKEDIVDASKIKPKVSYKTSEKRWKKLNNDKFYIKRPDDLSMIALKVPLPKDAYKKDGAYFFKISVQLYGWEDCNDYRAYMDSKEIDCGPPSILTFDPRAFKYPVGKLKFILSFEKKIPYSKVKYFDQDTSKLMDDRKSSKAFIKSETKKGKRFEYSLAISNPQNPIVVLFEQDLFDVNSITDTEIKK